MNLLTEQLRNGHIEPVDAIHKAADICDDKIIEAFLRELPARLDAELDGERRELQEAKEDAKEVAEEGLAEARKEGYSEGWNACLATIEDNLPSSR